MGGAFPGAEFLGVPVVLVVHNGAVAAEGGIRNAECGMVNEEQRAEVGNR